MKAIIVLGARIDRITASLMHPLSTLHLPLILSSFYCNQVLGHAVLIVDVLLGSMIYTCAGRALGNVLLKVF